jgi:hypothetical protein
MGRYCTFSNLLDNFKRLTDKLKKTLQYLTNKICIYCVYLQYDFNIKL